MGPAKMSVEGGGPLGLGLLSAKEIHIVNSCSARTILVAVALDPNDLRLISGGGGVGASATGGSASVSAAWTFPASAPVQKLTLTKGRSAVVNLSGKQAYVTVLIPGKPGYWVILDSRLLKKGSTLTIDDSHLLSKVARIPEW